MGVSRQSTYTELASMTLLRSLPENVAGPIPWENLKLDGYEGASPVDAFPANGYGLYDMIGNVWEWTASSFAPPAESEKSCCAPSEPGARLVHNSGRRALMLNGN
jgi:formylglycine-generating enzyme required for sulfatase activity